jgi:S-adenosylmethionine synthetase
VTEGHPDKIADQISDAVLDALIAQDPQSRVACEVLVTTGLAVVAGEISSRGYVEIPSLVRRVIGEIGYDSAEYGFDSHTCAVVTTIDDQSPDIALGVDKGGAGDQGLMFGFACRETRQLMPLPIMLAHAITRRLAHVRRRGIIPYLRPDGKSQVTVEYDDGRPVRVDTVVVSSQHAAEVRHSTIERDIIEHVVMPILPKRMVKRGAKIKFHINPTGSFVKGGPMADTGLTGRKIIVDTYGGVGSHGGGAFSGKDPSKVDRSASYGARYVAKNLVASGLCDRCEVQIAYAIGIPEPVSVMVDTKRTGKVSDEKLTALVRKHFDLTPRGLIKHLRLRRPIFRVTAAYGHFGRSEPTFTWERTDRARLLARSV